MRFGDPFAFWFLLAVPALLLFYVWGFRRKRRALAEFGNPKLVAKLTQMTSAGRQWVKAGLSMLGLLFLVLALVQPQFGTKMELIHRRGVDLVIALDTSLSMLAEDIR
ncbi:MAG: BatA domain-containing protein, partial [bacterium]|nr:BatA domain-containing protein [bacterium]